MNIYYFIFFSTLIKKIIEKISIRNRKLMIGTDFSDKKYRY